ncbi:hypothetical protein DL89DRAFT_325527 [Linderina pennispora]|uniref:Ribosomal protein L10 n=1 Tax=Linderina pennispora TaxID=61395 RepID=A0A1Y1VWM8_9FUNG|nr:uncharacterized protein DL89DRAFT_325527 [Linderina pennispora]ORX65699.1 hypothetical protein DL89DRAFT_325527 [Linderina pennispora]
MFSLARTAFRIRAPVQRTMATAAVSSRLERSRPAKTHTEYKKPFSARKQFLFGEYEAHFHHNLSGSEQAAQRRDLKLNAQGAKLMIVRSRMVQAVLRDTAYANLTSLFSGPSAIVYWQKDAMAEDFDPVLAMRQAMEITGQQRKMDFVNMPNIDQLRAQIIGVVQSPSQQLASLLQRIPQRLAGVLKQRADGESQEAK